MNIPLVLACIAQLEQGPTKTHHGPYCMSDAAIVDVNELTDGSFSSKKIDGNRKEAYRCAEIYLAILTARLAGQLGAAPSVMELAAAWRGGANGWREHVSDYGRRAANLYEDAVRRR